MPLQLPPPLFPKRRNPMDEILARIGRPRALGGIQDASTMPMEIPRELPPFIEAPVADRLPIGNPLPSRQPQVPVRQTSENLEMRLRESDLPPTLKQTLMQAMLSAAPIAAGAAFGGSEGASGAAQGVMAYNANQQGLKESRRKTLVEQIQEQKTREQQSSEAAKTREQQSMEAGLTRGQQASEFDVTQRGAEAGRRIQQETLNETIARDKAAQELAENQPLLVGADVNAVNRKTGKLLFQGPPKPPSMNDLHPTVRAYKTDPTKGVNVYEDTERTSPTFSHVFIGTSQGPKDVTDQVTYFHEPNMGSPSSGLSTIIYTDKAGVNRQGIINMITGKIRNVETPEHDIAAPKFGEVPAQIKVQATAAVTALKQMDNIEKIISKNPHLIGPFAGRFEQFMLGVGTNPFAGTKDAQLGAQLAEHLNALFAQELRSMFGARTNEQMQNLVKQTSPQLKQDPAFMKGILEGIKVNEGFVLDTAKAQGFVEDRFSGAGWPGAPKIGTIKNGYIYQGGNPADPVSWKKQ